MTHDPSKDEPEAETSKSVEDDPAQAIAEQNRRKLEEHLAKLQSEGLKPKSKKSSKDSGTSAEGGKKQIPKPPPKPAGWEAWKHAQAGRMHQLRPVDAKVLSREADFRLLDLKPGASQEEIKRNFNRLAKEFHPDKGGDAEVFNALRQAFNRLSK